MISPLHPGAYASAAAFYAALEARLREAAGGDAHRWDLMRTQFAISRLLVRLQSTQPGEWLTKGGTSMLARLDGRCRLSRDLDIQHRELAKAGREGLNRAARSDADDWLRFQVETSRPLRQEEFQGIRFRMTAWVGVKQLARFGVDVVEEMTTCGRVELRRPYSPIPIVGAPDVEVPLYPVEDHVADKISAMGKVRRHGDSLVVSTRYRDLADLALLATSMTIEAGPLTAALAEPPRHWARDTFGETGFRLPGPEWSLRYAETVLVEPAVRERWPTAEAALAVAKPLVDPALSGEARGVWDPAAASWRG